MAALSEEVKAYIVQALACYDTPTQVSESVKEEFGVEVARHHVAIYDPTKHSGKTLGRKWRDLFESTRERFRREVSEIPIADQAFRLRQLQRIMADAVKRKNTVLAAQILEQAAKEAGGMFTNRREFTGANGGPIRAQVETVDKSLAESLAAKLVD